MCSSSVCPSYYLRALRLQAGHKGGTRRGGLDTRDPAALIRVTAGTRSPTRDAARTLYKSMAHSMSGLSRVCARGEGGRVRAACNTTAAITRPPCSIQSSGRGSQTIAFASGPHCSSFSDSLHGGRRQKENIVTPRISINPEPSGTAGRGRERGGTRGPTDECCTCKQGVCAVLSLRRSDEGAFCPRLRDLSHLHTKRSLSMQAALDALLCGPAKLHCDAALMGCDGGSCDPLLPIPHASPDRDISIY